MKTLLHYLFTGKSLSEEQAYIALKDIASGNQNDAQIAAFLTVYNMRMVTVHELTGFRKAMLELAIPVKFKQKNTLDIVGTGGDGKDTFNCGPAVATIPFSLVKIVNLGNVTIDGGDRIILNANNNDRHFFAGSGVTFRLRAITLRDGSSLVGGGAIEASGADVILDDVDRKGTKD